MIVKCQQDSCTEIKAWACEWTDIQSAIALHMPISPVYVCKQHAPRQPQGVFLQQHQFDKRLHPGYFSEPQGMQVHVIRQEEIDIPDWTQSDEQVQALLRRSFPGLDTDERQRYRATRWVAVIHFYYRLRYSEGDTAAELHMTAKEVNSVILRITRVSQGLRSDGSGELTRKPRGRPKKQCGDQNLFIEGE